VSCHVSISGVVVTGVVAFMVLVDLITLIAPVHNNQTPPRLLQTAH
jgi:hypothetical protein